MPAKKISEEKVVEPAVSLAKKTVKKFFRLSPTERESVYSQINENAKGNFPYFFITVLSTIIITLGLIINSGTVIIGGMLITPILWPILSFSISITRGRVATIKKSSSVLFISALLVLVVSALVGYISPFNTLGNEVLVRTKPTLIELLIGLSAGLVAAYSVSSKKILSNIAGVAIAVSLVPPLCVTGLAIISGDFTSTIGSLLLFLSNLLAIIVASVIVFMAEGYFTQTTSTNAQNTRRSYITWSFTLLIITLLPLLIITRSLVYSQSRDNFVAHTTKTIYPTAEIIEISTQDEGVFVEVNITIQSESQVSQEVIDKLSSIYSTKFKKPVTLNLTTILVSKSSSTNFSVTK